VTLPFDLPAPGGFKSQPLWNGVKFVYDDQAVPVLEYSENFAGWSDDLTALHEAAAGDSHPIDLASRNDALAQVGQSLPSGQAVILEIGCSSGFLIKDLVKAFPQAVVVGADVVKEPLHKLARELPGVPLIRFDLLQCPLPEESVDIMVMLNVLEHIEDDVLALQNAFKLLKPGGSLVIEVPAGKYLYDSYDAQLHHFRRYSAAELRSKLTHAGFTVSRKSHLGFLLFPAFAAVKLLNKVRGQTKAIVHDQAASTSGSTLVAIAMKLEAKLSNLFSLPYGIRVLMTAKRSG
jgi:trans-aconitate methyltransferase